MRSTHVTEIKFNTYNELSALYFIYMQLFFNSRFSRKFSVTVWLFSISSGLTLFYSGSVIFPAIYTSRITKNYYINGLFPAFFIVNVK